ncbi:MAG: hypothetical protein U5O39_14770 [Gammaproteobacteria bacterium]|nr:hypothetical protein [Gammaproteobacteria bacterium]
MPLSLEPDGSVTCLEVSDAVDLDLPFYEHALRDYRERFPGAPERAIPRAELTKVPERIPAGIIFHASKCGSTLIGQALSRLPECTVFSEALPFNQAIHRPRAERSEMIRSTFSLAATLRPNDHLVIKQTSINVIRMSSVLAAWPDVPWIVVFRHPVEIMVCGGAKQDGMGEALRHAGGAGTDRRRSGRSRRTRIRAVHGARPRPDVHQGDRARQRGVGCSSTMPICHQSCW